ncbi:MAG: CRISPR-associated endonuclease Cas2 [Candidatus Zambryskibacteria bacterium RIFCSPHIGHO2_02_FULL_43_14]|uniref:CRISPR-associated endonuclease Cas2 n=1 Tax=Candidatus Zambryskibacteria bacterium RIFCSPHIGHO2_02_FULL_43_14 TaxID=1802748 RepID=A0A1G2THG3_9BACT|nr:MAG: CRISPR-associated endonuclease Cas2 [Candidatus Zambryskibacteria bacterium RIFCSPHIGHO2_01_FULL_43_60]OHA96643.1 MAG: CRISPR-associated endonuclease Cas2 [Candidatus Zambryskibacteria bacterium RIFCSPHIGHO2_02_FULL_43_14]OHB04015.1 MAG: CRISPR-associated endonuclease Cas2 [Candidatus Zambryskibacteria bacterium RIFCSPLOWO2_01_FULL_42_41]
MPRRGSTQEKILLLLLGGLTLGLSRSPRGYLKILGAIHEEWKEIDRRYLISSIRTLYKSKLIHQKDNKDGTTTFILSSEGKRAALTYNLDKMVVKRHKWDKKWRIVIFDIPEKKKKIREMFRYQLKRLGFIELQRSVFVISFECRNEIEYIVEFYNIRKFVRFIEASHIDNELDLKHRFSLV